MSLNDKFWEDALDVMLIVLTILTGALIIRGLWLIFELQNATQKVTSNN